MTAAISCDVVDSNINEFIPDIQSGLEKMEKSTSLKNGWIYSTRLLTVYTILQSVNSSSNNNDAKDLPTLQFSTQRLSHPCAKITAIPNYSTDYAINKIQEAVNNVLFSFKDLDSLPIKCWVFIELWHPSFGGGTIEIKEICNLKFNPSTPHSIKI